MIRTKSPHFIELRNREGTEAEISTGHNTAVFIDGMPLHGITRLEIVAQYGQTTKVIIELDAEVDAKVKAEIEYPTEPTTLEVVRMDGKVVGKIEV